MKSKKQLEELQNELFQLEMKDRWTNEDYRKVQELREKIKELENG